MRSERSEKPASEDELIARLSANKEVVKKQQLAELLRSRIEELNRRLASLHSARRKE